MKRRPIEVFSLSFLDCICCGFGATLLLYVIFNMSVARRAQAVTTGARAEASQVQAELEAATRRLAELRNQLEETDARLVEARGLSSRVLERLEQAREELATHARTSIARRAAVEQLKSDLRTLEADTRRLSALAPSAGIPGDRVRSHPGDGERLYLSGLRLGGDRVLILLDSSASMLGDTLVNVIRRRNLPDARKRQADKWQRAVASLDWLLARLPRSSRFQVYAFDESARPLLADSAGRWLDGGDRGVLEGVFARARELVPAGGTSLENAFAAAAALSPPPDNIVLLTDGLPTQGARPRRGGTVSGRERLQLFERAREALPAQVPINTILLPMEGDPLASSAFWKLAIESRGSLLTPARDWP